LIDFQTYSLKWRSIWLVVAIFLSSESVFCSQNDCISVIYEPVICIGEEVRFSLKTLGTCTITDIKWNFGTDASIKILEGAEPELLSFIEIGKKEISIQYYDHEKEELVNRIISVEVIQPISEITITQPKPCIGQTIELNAEGPVVGYYVWKGGNLPDNGVSGNLEYKITDKLTTPNQTYSLEWYVGNGGGDGGCSYRRISKMVEEKTNLPIEFVTGNTIKVCEGDAVKIDIKNSENIQYNWNCAENSLIRQGNSIEFTPTQSCEIKVSGFDGDCLRSGSVNVTVQEVPEIQIYPEFSMICAGSSIELQILAAIPGETYLWSDNVFPQNTYANTVMVAPESSDTYEVTWVSGKCTSSATASIKVSNITDILENKTISICEGEEVSLKVARPNDGFVQWFGGDLEELILGEEVNVSPSSTTTYSVIWQNNICSDTGMVKVKVNPTPQIKLFSSVKERVCKGEEVLITAEVTNGISENDFIWHQTNEQQRTANHFNELSFIAQKSHTIVAEWIDENELCQNIVTASLDLEVIERPTQLTLQSNVAKVCYGDTVHFKITSDADNSKYILLNADTNETIGSDELIGDGFSLKPDTTTNYVAWWVDDCQTSSNRLYRI